LVAEIVETRLPGDHVFHVLDDEVDGVGVRIIVGGAGLQAVLDGAHGHTVVASGWAAVVYKTWGWVTGVIRVGYIVRQVVVDSVTALGATLRSTAGTWAAVVDEEIRVVVGSVSWAGDRD